MTSIGINTGYDLCCILRFHSKNASTTLSSSRMKRTSSNFAMSLTWEGSDGNLDV